MKKLFKTFAAVALIGSISFLSSCDKVCDEGYEGDDCKTQIRTKFLGAYNTVNEVCTSGGPSSFGIAVTAGTNILEINLSNLYGAGLNTKATVNEARTVTIASQTFGSGQISGSGSLSADGNTLTLSYTVTGGGASDNCNNITFTK